MNVPAIVLLVLAASLLSAYFGPFGRSYRLVLWLALALGTEGAALLLERPYSTYGRMTAGLFGLAFVYAYVVQVRERYATLRKERVLRAQTLAHELETLRTEPHSAITKEIENGS
ncbi:MAG: hypothetical protein M3Y56_11295 [Armatimonadota bacterium]|nr:hypothetical protein [Armatimonadota bacterium]